MANKYVKVGAKANIFHDQSTGITVCKGEIVELNQAQLVSKRVRAALAAGHLEYANPELEKDLLKEEKAEKLPELSKRFHDMYKSGKDSKKASEAFTLAELKQLAEASEIEIDDNDTKATIAQALYEDIEESEEK